MDGLMQERRNFIASALELSLSCINLLIYSMITISVGYRSNNVFTKDTPYLIPTTLMGELWSVFCEYFGKKSLYHNEVSMG